MCRAAAPRPRRIDKDDLVLKEYSTQQFLYVQRITRRQQLSLQTVHDHGRLVSVCAELCFAMGHVASPRAPCRAILESEAADYSAQPSRTIAADATKQDGDNVLEAVEHEAMAGPYFLTG